VLFGIAHSEQGIVGVVTITLDGLVFCGLRLHFRTLWAPVLAHGFNNTIGFVAFYFVGPVYGLW
jgi:membrane protease YdiL (CAAX protease family)